MPGLQLLEDCLQWDPDKRPTAQQALKYPFFQITKRATDTVHTIPLTTSHISQQQQSSIHHHSTTIPNGRTSNMSFASLDNVDTNKFTSDSEFVRNYGVASHTTIYPSNGIKQIVLENNRRNSINNNTTNGNQNGNAGSSNAIDYDEDIIKSMKIENGINFSLFNGTFNNSSALNNNHHQPERSLDASENVSQPIGYNNSINSSVNSVSVNNSNKLKQNQIANYRDGRRDSVDIGTAISSSTITQTSRDSPMPNSNAFAGSVRQNGSAITTARIQTNDTLQSMSTNRQHPQHAPANGYANGMKSMSNANNDLFNGYDSRRSSRTTIDENPFFKEKISDIFVNRNVGGGVGAPLGKLYNGSDGTIYSQNVYANKSVETTANEYGQKNKAFYLHDAKKSKKDDPIYANADAKVYNIFSKQRLAKSFTQDKTNKNAGGGSEENSYLAMKLPTVPAPIKQQAQVKPLPSWDSFEDDELAKILG